MKDLLLQREMRVEVRMAKFNTVMNALGALARGKNP